MNKIIDFLRKNKKIILVAITVVIGVVVIIYLALKTDSSKTATVEIGRTPDNQPITINYDLKYSFNDYTNRNLLDAKDLNGKTIYATMFLQEIPDSHIFPDDLKDVTFVKCNLDDVYINPKWENVQFIQSSMKRFQVQNDLRDWLIDENNKPIEVLGKEYWESLGYSVDPKDIPDKPLKDISEIKSR